MGFFNCSRCDKAFKSELGLVRHLGESHSINIEKYILETKHHGVIPKCQCGCNQEVKYQTGIRDYGRFIPGHQSRVNNNFQTEKSIKNSKETKAKQKKLGILKGKDSEETRKKKSESHKGNKNYMYGKSHSPDTKQIVSKKKKEYFANNPSAKQANGDRSREYWSKEENKQLQSQAKLRLEGFLEDEIRQHEEIAHRIKIEKVEASVYCIQIENTDIFKIGFTTLHPFKRMSNLQISHPQKLKLIHWFPTKHGMNLEKALHIKFKDFNLKGEWFKLSQEQISDFLLICNSLEKILSI